VVLVAEPDSGGADCWGALPGTLCGSGFEVAVPEPRRHANGASALGPLRGEQALQAGDAARWGAALSDSVRGVVVVAVGWAGALARRIAGPGRELLGLVWLSPSGDLSVLEGGPANASMPPLLLISSAEDILGSRVAESLFTRFNATSELRQFSRGAGGCALLGGPGVQDGVVEWVKQAAAPGAP
jgi:hypothetical protein